MHVGAGTASLKQLSSSFVWDTMSTDMTAFMAGCLNCLSTQGSKVPSPFGKTARVTTPNVLLHFDFLSFTDKHSRDFVYCGRAIADSVYHSFPDWLKRFGIVHSWDSDQGSLFISEMILKLCYLLGSQHHFVTVYSSWANRLVEVINRLVLRSLKVLLGELKLPVNQWPQMLPLA
ncbi:hypothetical protein PHMEG_0005856 [Phytophthora megakarya]|uniref:Integrase catalytic domain-containing protein n=1 Tax=Phytophthora megakarya TaxID=4795 RepID=A0A225WS11_9STRA|nr:hypothetical protein PHMEG_0005856 [Phytophthora megakarya]